MNDTVVPAQVMQWMKEMVATPVDPREDDYVWGYSAGQRYVAVEFFQKLKEHHNVK